MENTKEVMENLKLSIVMAEIMVNDGDISRDVRYEKFMETSYNIGSLGWKVKAAEAYRIEYEDRRKMIARELIARELENLTKECPVCGEVGGKHSDDACKPSKQ